MKRLFALAVLTAMFAMIGSASADSPRKVLFEHFTSASCAPCAAVAPTYYAFIQQNMNTIIPISYHGNYSNDVMEDHWNEGTSKLFQYYGFSGVPSLAIQGNKWKGHPGSLTSYQGLPAQIGGETSQYDITVTSVKTGTKNDVKVTVKSSKKVLAPSILRVAVVEAYHYYEAAGNNGEKDFYYIPRNMLPNSDGTVIAKFDAGVAKEFEFTYNDHPEWYSNMMYVVAWVQDQASKEIYQVGSTPIPDVSNAPNTPKISFNLSSTTQYNKVTEMTETKKKMKITNPYTYPIKANISIDASSYLPEDWTVVLNKTTATIPASGAVEVEVSVTPGTTPAMGIVLVNVVPTELENGFAVGKNYGMYFLSDEVKYAVFYAGNAMTAHYYYPLALSLTDYGANTALIPFNSTVAAAYPPENFDVAFFNSSSQYQAYSYLNTDQINYIKAMLEKGKHVFVSADALGKVMTHPQAPASLKTALSDFVNNVLQIKYKATVERIVNSTLVSYIVNGVPTDTIGAGYGATYNQSNQNYTYVNEYFEIPSGSPAHPVAYYDGNPDQVAAVRLEKPNGARLVFLGYPLEATNNQNLVTLFIENAMKWMVGYQEVLNPEIISDLSEMDFEQVEIGKDKELPIEIENIGAAELKISKVEIRSDADAVYSVVNPETATLAPGEKKIYTVKFAPKDEKNYNFAQVVFHSNDPLSKSYSVDLKGSGLLPAANGPRVKIDIEKLDFGKVMETLYYDLDLPVRNTGVSELNLTNIEIEGATNNNFKVISNNPDAIAPAGTFSIKVRFAPAAVGIVSAKLKFATNDTEKPVVEIPLEAEGIPFISVPEGTFGSEDVFTMTAGPNPFANSTNLKFNVVGNTAKDVNIAVLDASGKQVALLVNGTVAPGEHNVRFDGNFLASGTYFVVANVGSYSATMPLVVVK